MTADASPTVELSTLTSNVPEALPSPVATSMTFTTDPQQTLLITNFECIRRARAGVSLRELMERMGHSTSRAALIYLHSTDER
jgi:hypothetical protein